MARQAPWSVKGIDDGTRQIARDAAEAAGLPIGAWIDRAILRTTAGTGTAAVSGSPFPATASPPRPAAGRETGPARAGTAQLDRAAAAPSGPARAPQHFAGDPVAGREALQHRGRRRGAPALIAAMLAVVLALGGGLWVMLDPMATPSPSEAAKAPATGVPPAGTDGGEIATAAPEQTGPAPATPSPVPEQPGPAATTPSRATGAPGGDGRLARLTDAARAGDARAQYDLGMLYSRGDGVARDDKAAAEWFERAALRGLAGAQHNLGVLYEEGRGVPANPQLAFFWYRSAADQGHAGAQHNLGTLYAEGSGTPRDYEKAAELFGKAAAGGASEGDYSLGLLHELGLGVARDMERALEHYRKASAAGNEKAAARLKQVAAVPGNTAALPAPEADWLTEPVAATPETPVPVASPLLERKGIAEVQRLLRQLSFEPGPPDGIAGGRTIDAIRLYQRFAGLGIDGKPTEALLQDLRQVVGAMNGEIAPPAGSTGP